VVEVCELRERLLQCEYDLSLLSLGAKPQEPEERPQGEQPRPEHEVLFSSSASSHWTRNIPSKLEEQASAPAAPASAAASPTRPIHFFPKAVLGQVRSALLDGNGAQFGKLLAQHPTLDLAATSLLPYHLALQGWAFHGDMRRVSQTLEAVARHEKTRATSGSDSLLAAVNEGGESVLHALFKHVGTASAFLPLLEKILSLAATMATRLHPHTRNADGKSALELCLLLALAWPEALSGLRQLLELSEAKDAGSLLSLALVQASNQLHQQGRNRRSTAAGNRRGEGGSRALEVLSLLSHHSKEAGWDAQWKDSNSGKGQGELLAALAPSSPSNEKVRLLYDKLVRTALCKGILVCAGKEAGI
jgi:hypothetical protein